MLRLSRNPDYKNRKSCDSIEAITPSASLPPRRLAVSFFPPEQGREGVGG